MTRATRLARRAARRRPGGSRGLLARRAWRLLTSAGDAGDVCAMAAAWQAWLRRPDDELWQALSRWRELQVLTETVFAAAVEPDRAPGERAAIGEFCVRHGMTPDDDIAQALFYALTRQAAQHRAADPDGRLLAVAYDRADSQIRAVLREMLAEAGDLDLIRVLASTGERARATPVTDSESEHLIRELTARPDWDRLWRLVQDLPLGRAVAAVRQFGDGWQPDADRERVLFDRLIHAHPERITQAYDALAALGVTRTTFTDRQHVMHGAVSDDGSLLALVRGESAQYGGGGTISIHELPSGSPGDNVRHGSMRIDAPDIEAWPQAVVVAFAGRTLIAANVGITLDPAEALLVRYADGHPEPLTGLRATLGDSTVYGLAPYPATGGFALLCDNCVYLCAGDGTLVTRIPLLHELSLEHPPDTGATLLDTEPGGRVAVAGRRGDGYCGWVVHDPETGQVVAREPGKDRLTGICFYGPDHLVITSEDWRGRHSRVGLWRLDGPQAVQVAAKRLVSKYVSCPVVIPGRGQVGVRDEYSSIFDAATLQGAHVPPAFRARSGTQWNSADKRIWGFAGEGFAAVFPGVRTVAAIADRPPAEWKPADLATVAEALAGLAIDATVRPFVELLYAGLDCRFGSDVGIAGPTAPGGQDDIGLSRELAERDPGR